MSKAQYLDRSQYNRLFPYMMYSNALALRVALETGLRIDDVLSLRHDDLDGVTLHYVAKKTGKSGSCRVSKWLADELRNVPTTGYFFPKRGGKKGHRTRQAVYIDMERALRRADLEAHASPHSARKTFAVDLLRKTGDINSVREALQHSNADTTAIYAYADHASKQNCFGCLMQSLPVISRAIAEEVVKLINCQIS